MPSPCTLNASMGEKENLKVLANVPDNIIIFWDARRLYGCTNPKMATSE